MNEAGILFLVLMMAVAMFAGPILAIIALVRLRTVEKKNAAAVASLRARLDAQVYSIPWRALHSLWISALTRQ